MKLRQAEALLASPLRRLRKSELLKGANHGPRTMITDDGRTDGKKNLTADDGRTMTVILNQVLNFPSLWKFSPTKIPIDWETSSSSSPSHR